MFKRRLAKSIFIEYFKRKRCCKLISKDQYIDIEDFIFRPIISFFDNRGEELITAARSSTFSCPYLDIKIISNKEVKIVQGIMSISLAYNDVCNFFTYLYFIDSVVASIREGRNAVKEYVKRNIFLINQM